MSQFQRKQLVEKMVRKVTSVSNMILLILVFIFIFLLSFLPESIHPLVQRFLFSLIFIASVFALETNRKQIIIMAVIAFITEWLSGIGNFTVLHYISFAANMIFFQFIVIKLIIQISKRKEVDVRVILESINGYLMLGMLFTTLVIILVRYDPGAFNFKPGGIAALSRDSIYFTFVTLTSTGYGEYTPQIPVARSLAILISTAGQLYIAIIIAMLVGKYASRTVTS
jgi:hypothetical protein